MRLFGRVLALSGVLVFAVACDTNQPASVNQGTAMIEYQVESADMYAAVVYPNLRVDTNGDGVPDAVISALNEFNAPPVCEVDVNRPTRVDIPWPFALEVIVVRSGSTDETVIETTGSGTGSYGFSRYTVYEDAGTPLADRPIDPPAPVSGARTAYAYTDGTETTNGSRAFLLACASVDPDSLPAYQNTTFQVGRGDLIRVQARRAAAGVTTGGPSEFRATLLIDGVPVDVTGTSSVDAGESGLAFSYLFN